MKLVFRETYFGLDCVVYKFIGSYYCVGIQPPIGLTKWPDNKFSNIMTSYHGLECLDDKKRNYLCRAYASYSSKNDPAFIKSEMIKLAVLVANFGIIT